MELKSLNSNGGVFSIIQADYGASVCPGGKGTVGTLTTDSLNLGFGSIVDFDINADGKADQLIVNKAMKIETKDWTQGPEYLVPRFNINFINGVVAGTYQLGTVAAVDGELGKITITGLQGHKTSLVCTDGRLVLTVADMRAATNVEWSGANSTTWDLADQENFTNTSEKKSDVFVTGDSVTFNDSATSGTVVIKGGVSPAAVTFDNSNVEYNVFGDAITGTTTLTKRGAGKTTLTNTSSFAGKTTIENGTLVVNNLGQKGGVNNGALGVYTNEVNLNGGTLEATESMTTDHPITLGKNGGSLLVDEGKELRMNSSITGSGYTLTKDGTGSLTLPPTVNFSKLIVNGGTVNSQESNNVQGYPKTVVLNNGAALNDADNFLTYTSNGVNVEVPEGATASWYLDGRCNYTGGLTGAGTLNIYSRSTRAYINGYWGDFAGTLKIAGQKTGSYTPVLYVTGSLKNAIVSASIHLDNNGKSVEVGSIAGSAQLDGAGTWALGGNNKDFTFNGTINNGKLAKTGNGIMTMSNVQSKIGGTVSVTGGTLNLNSALVTLKDANRLFGAYGVSVANGGTLAGRGVLEKIEVDNGGILAPGSVTSTTRYSALRTVSGIYLYDGARAEFLINDGKNTDASHTSLITNGMLSLAPGSMITVNLKSTYTPAVGDSCTLWTAADFSGSADNVTLNLPTLPAGLNWDTSELFQTTGILKVVIGTGIKNLTLDEASTGQVYDMAGRCYGIIKTSKASAVQDLRKQGLSQGVYVIRAGGDSMKVVVK